MIVDVTSYGPSCAMSGGNLGEASGETGDRPIQEPRCEIWGGSVIARFCWNEGVRGTELTVCVISYCLFPLFVLFSLRVIGKRCVR